MDTTSSKCVRIASRTKSEAGAVHLLDRQAIEIDGGDTAQIYGRHRRAPRACARAERLATTFAAKTVSDGMLVEIVIRKGIAPCRDGEGICANEREEETFAPAVRAIAAYRFRRRVLRNFKSDNATMTATLVRHVHPPSSAGTDITGC